MHSTQHKSKGKEKIKTNNKRHKRSAFTSPFSHSRTKQIAWKIHNIVTTQSLHPMFTTFFFFSFLHSLVDVIDFYDFYFVSPFFLSILYLFVFSIFSSYCRKNEEERFSQSFVIRFVDVRVSFKWSRYEFSEKKRSFSERWSEKRSSNLKKKVLMKRCLVID